MTEHGPSTPSPATRRRGGGAGTAVLGAILVAAGIAFFIGQQVDLR